MTIDERQELLSNIALDEEADKNTRIKAIDTLNKMDGVYITKAEVSGKDGGPIEIGWAE